MFRIFALLFGVIGGGAGVLSGIRSHIDLRRRTAARRRHKLPWEE